MAKIAYGLYDYGFEKTLVVVNEKEGHYYNTNGKYMKTEPFMDSNLFLEFVDVISILMIGSELEIAFSIEGYMEKGKTELKLHEILPLLNRATGLVSILTKDLLVEDTRCAQFLYVFKEGKLQRDKVRGILKIC